MYAIKTKNQENKGYKVRMQNVKKEFNCIASVWNKLIEVGGGEGANLSYFVNEQHL